MKWALVVAAGEGHRSRAARELSRALAAQGLHVMSLPARRSEEAGPRSAEIAVEAADVLVLDATRSLELAGEGQRAAIEEARGRGRLLVLVFREDQLVRGVERLGLGPPVATHVEGESSAARQAFIATAAAVAAGREPPGPPQPIHARMTDEAWQALRRHHRRLATVGGPMTALTAWAFGHGRVEDSLLEPVSKVFSWLLLGLVAVSTGVVLAGRYPGIRALEISLAGDELEVTTGPRASWRIPRTQLSSVRESALGLRLYGWWTGILAPRGMESYDRLREGLARWRPIERHRIDLPLPPWAALPFLTLFTTRWPTWFQPVSFLLGLGLAGLFLAASIVNEGVPRWRRWGQRGFAALVLVLVGLSAHGEWREQRARAALLEREQRIRLVLGERPTLDDLDWVLRYRLSARAEPLGPKGGAPSTLPAKAGRAWILDARLADRVLAGSGGELRGRGLSLVRLAGAPVEPGTAVLAGFATADLREVVRLLGTGSPRDGIATEHVIAWLEALAELAPFELTAVGPRTLEGRLAQVPLDIEPVARLIAGLTPGAGPDAIPALADRLRRTGEFALAWDQPDATR